MSDTKRKEVRADVFYHEGRLPPILYWLYLVQGRVCLQYHGVRGMANRSLVGALQLNRIVKK